MILVTTRAGDYIDNVSSDGVDQFHFFARHTTVAFSRPKRALTVICDFALLKGNVVWHRFIKAAIV